MDISGNVTGTNKETNEQGKIGPVEAGWLILAILMTIPVIRRIIEIPAH